MGWYAPSTHASSYAVDSKFGWIVIANACSSFAVGFVARASLSLSFKCSTADDLEIVGWPITGVMIKLLLKSQEGKA